MAKGLGRSFDSLIPSDLDVFDKVSDFATDTTNLKEIALDKIEPDPNQPRRKFEEASLQALAQSIKEHGVLQPIILSKEENGRYMIVTGERRWRASKLAGKDKIPAIIRSLDTQKRLELAIIENLQREDLNSLEIASAYLRLKTQFNLSDTDIANKLGKSRSAVINTMRLLNLPDKAKKLMLEHGLSEGQMRPLIKATPEEIDAVLPKIIAEDWSARKIEQYMVRLKAQRQAVDKTAHRQIDEQLYRKLDHIKAHTGFKATITTNTKGAGEMKIKFKNRKELDKLCTILTTPN